MRLLVSLFTLAHARLTEVPDERDIVSLHSAQRRDQGGPSDSLRVKLEPLLQGHVVLLVGSQRGVRKHLVDRLLILAQSGRLGPSLVVPVFWHCPVERGDLLRHRARHGDG